MALPPEDEGAPPEGSAPRSDVQIIEARDVRERRCADCGKTTDRWKPVRRKGTTVLLCAECAAKPLPAEDAETCPKCGARLEIGDTFCGRCGQRIEYACPGCSAVLEATDTFCGKCGHRVL